MFYSSSCFELLVLCVFFIEEAVPQFYFESNRDTLNREDALLVKCVADLYIYRDVVIQKDGADIKAERSEVNETIILGFAKEAVLNDGGEYVCIGYLKRGGQNTRNIKITVKGMNFKILILFRGFLRNFFWWFCMN